ncbi:MAG: hypothetical protein AAF393_10675 [Pseudomonadota bacterium]
MDLRVRGYASWLGVCLPQGGILILVMKTRLGKEAVLTYRPDHFKSLAKTKEAKALWNWLQEEPQRLVMQVAARLHRPPVEALSYPLTDSFPAVCSQHRKRQMVGHMVRQIMLADGFQPDRSNVKIISRTSIFKRGSTYL